MEMNPAEDKEVKKIIKSIVEKWTRIVCRESEIEDDESFIQNKKRASVSVQDAHEKKLSSLRKSVPKLVTTKTGHDFIKKPKPLEANALQDKNDDFREVIRKINKKNF